MKNAAFLPTLLAMACLFLNGCGKSLADTDETKNPNYFFSSFANTVWRTKTKTALAEMKLYTGKQVMGLVSPRLFDPTDSDYMAVPKTYLRVVTVLPPGATIRMDRLMQDNGIGSTVNVIVSLENETNCQTTNLYLDTTFLANNSFFRGPVTLHRWGVNSNLLEAADSPQH